MKKKELKLETPEALDQDHIGSSQRKLGSNTSELRMTFT